MIIFRKTVVLNILYPYCNWYTANTYGGVASNGDKAIAQQKVSCFPRVFNIGFIRF